MAWYKNYEKQETKHVRFQNAPKTDYDFDNYTPVKSKSKTQENKFSKKIDQYVRFISWARWYPDLFLDMLRPKVYNNVTGEKEYSGVNLHFDQRIFLRCSLRFFSIYGVFPRGYGKTFLEVAACFCACILYPGLDISLTAQTKESAADFLKDKYKDLIEKYPSLSAELLDKKESKDDVTYIFTNNSTLSNLANSQNAKGTRRHRLMVEEAALLNNATFEDALKPVVDTTRMTKGKLGIPDPLELNGQIHFFTTAGFRGSEEFNRNLIMYLNMLQCSGEFVIGADWKLACWFGMGTRGLSKENLLKTKQTYNSVEFSKNYESKWAGAVENQLVDVNKLMECRVLTTPLLENKDNKHEIVLGVDVARSSSNSNDKTVISVVEEIHSENGLIKKMKLVNMYLLSNSINFSGQGIFIKRIQKQYNAKKVIVDLNGLGRGLVDELFKPCVDPNTGNEYEAWTSDNLDYCSDYENAVPILFPVIAIANQNNLASNSNMIINFISCIEGKKIDFLEERKENDFDILKKEGLSEFAPYEQTNELMNEILNLQLEHLNGGGVTVKQVLSKINKDRYSSLVYALWWIMNFDNKFIKNDDDLLINIAKMNYNSVNRNNSLQNIFR